VVSDQRIGSEIAGYRIEGVVGRGGMSVVYLADDPGLKRKVALKILSPELAEDQRFRDRFIRESQLAASLEHPNIVPIHEAGEADGVLFIAMRYVRGTDLKSLIARDGPLDPERALAIVSQVASALDAAHAEGLIHRDVKPSNVLVAEPDRSGAEHAYLTDFGLIRRVTQVTSLTRTGQFMGTIEYVAPEQIRGGEVDARADVYSLGCLLCECLTGEPPFVSDLEVTVLYAHLEEPPPRVTTRRPELPPAIDRVVAKAMAKLPEDRYVSAEALSAAVREALRPGPALPIPPEGVSTRSRRTIAIAAAAGIALVVVVAAMLVSRSGTPSPASSPPAPTAASSTSRPAALPLGSVVQLDPGTGKVLTVATNAIDTDVLPGNPRLAVGERGVWAHTIGVVSHIDERTGKLEDRFPAGPGSAAGAGAGTSLSIAVGARTVWVPTGGGTGGGPAALVPIDPATDQVLPTIRLGVGAEATDVAVGAGRVWVTLSDGNLDEVDPGTHRLLHSYPVGGHLDALTIGFGSVWVVDEVAGKISRIDPSTGSLIRALNVGGNVRAIVAGSGAVWVMDRFSGTVAAIDPDTNTLGAAIRVGDRPTGMAVGAGAVWVSDSGGSLWQVDPVTQSGIEIAVGGLLTAIAFDPQAGNLWLCVGGGPG